MRRPPALRWLSLAAMALCPAARGQTEAPLTYRAISAMTPAAVGRRLLGPERGADIARVEFLDFRAQRAGCRACCSYFYIRDRCRSARPIAASGAITMLWQARCPGNTGR